MTQRARTNVIFSTLMTLALLSFGLQAVSSIAACSSKQRHDTISASLTAVNAARDGFVVWDRAQGAKLLEQSGTREEFDAKIETYRADREKHLHAFELVYKALAIAAVQNDDPSLTAALAQAGALVVEIKKLTGGP